MSKQVNSGEIIFRQGESGDTFYEVIKGCVGIYLNYGEDSQQKLTDVREGHIFGEMALVDAFPRSATAVASEDSELNEVSVSEVKDYFKSNPDKIKNMLLELTGNLARLTDDYREVTSTVKELYPVNDEPRKPSLFEKIKKFAEAYDLIGKRQMPSAEYLRETSQDEHEKGYAKKVEKYKRGTIIFREGDLGRCMYDIHYGTVGIYTEYGTPNEKCLTTLSSNKFFGELGMLNSILRTATVVVLEDDTMLESIYADDFEELFDKNPAKIEMIIKHLSYRIRRLTYQYMDACKIVYDAAQADLKQSVNEELKKKAQEYTGNTYD